MAIPEQLLAPPAAPDPAAALVSDRGLARLIADYDGQLGVCHAQLGAISDLQEGKGKP